MDPNPTFLSLAGKWNFRMDAKDVGVDQRWYGDRISEDEIRLPGSMAEYGKGDDVGPDTPWTGRIRDMSYFEDPRYEKYRQPGNIKFPCWLTPLKFYKGVAWYQKVVSIPEEWEGHYVHLTLERPHWITQVWADGVEIGSQDSLGTPHEYNLGTLAGGNHVITIRIDNRLVIDVGEDAHSMTDHSQTSWNGIVGEIQLRATQRTWLENVQVYPKGDKSAVVVVARIAGQWDARCEIAGSIRDKATGQIVSVESAVTCGFDEGGGEVEFVVPVREPVCEWDEFHPVVYELSLCLTVDGEVIHRQKTDFGFRQFRAEGTRFYLNERAIYLRGTLECAVFPLTGYPPTDKAEWDRILGIAKDHGLNHLRFHSWCPPRAAFQAADEAGIVFSVECSSWTLVGENADYDAWLYREADELLRAYGNHPSFCMMLYGNEPYGDKAAEFLGQWVNHYKARDDRRLFSSGTAWPLIEENQFHVWMNPRIMLWDQNLDSRINAMPPETVTDYAKIIGEHPQPIISHEIGQWCVYPNFNEISKYTGVLRAYNFEIFRDFLVSNGMEDQAQDFLMASGRLQVLCYKEEIESALRTPGQAGFQLLDLHDFPGQGTALVGVLDAFWEEKGYITPDEFRRFCSRTVPLAKMARRVFTNDDVFAAELMLAHFDEKDLERGAIQWKLKAGSADYKGEILHSGLQAGMLHTVGQIEQSLSEIAGPAKLNLEVAVEGAAAVNDWDIWVYPKELDMTVPSGIHVTGELDSKAQEVLRAGGKVLWMPDRERVCGDGKGQVPAGFSSIFWNTAWTQGQQPHTLGILCDPEHPALAHFPTEYHSNWQWWYIIQQSRSMIMDPLAKTLRPVVQVIDDWFTARRLGLLFECQYEGGSMLVSSVDCKARESLDPVCRQWLYSLLKYMDGERFQPNQMVSYKEMSGVIRY